MLNPKLEIRNPKQTLNLQITNSKHYDLEERTFNFTKDIIQYIKNLPKTMPNLEITKQLIRSAGSIGANYIEANESLGKKDFLMKVKISKKEAKESNYWLRLTECGDNFREEKIRLLQEPEELMKILGAILAKCC